MSSARFKWTAFGLALLAVGAYQLERSPRTAADDGDHTTSLTSTNFDFTGSSESALVASLATSSELDDKLVTTMYVTPNGGSEHLAAIGEAPRNGVSGSFSQDTALDQASLNSGDYVRVVFSAYGSLGNQTFSYQRTYTKP
jgi:hypothetical protein